MSVCISSFSRDGEVSGVEVDTSRCRLLFQGAEAKIFETRLLNRRVIIKHRFEKKYRQAQLDRSIRNSRVAKESRNLVKCFIGGINCPNVHFVDVNNGIIVMDYIDGLTLNDYLNSICSKTEDKLTEISREIGHAISSLHKHVIHGDLTVSNIIISDNEKDKPQINFIDFGLSYCDSLSIEDKAVDLYVLERSLQVTHPNMSIMDSILEGYLKTQENGTKIINRYNQVKSRGRKKDELSY